MYIRDHPRKAQDIYSRAHLNSSSSSGISSSSSAGGHSSPNSHSPSSLSPRQPSPIGWNSSSDSLELCSSLLRDISNEDKHFPSMSKICDKTGKVEEHIWMPTNGKVKVHHSLFVYCMVLTESGTTLISQPCLYIWVNVPFSTQ